MNLHHLARSGIWLALGGLLAATSGARALTACGESASCTRLRNDTYAAKQVWDACNPADPEPCVKVFGNVKDCTGVLACDFAVNPAQRAAAEQAVLSIGEQSQGCYLCATPNCPTGDIAFCEPVSRRCIVVIGVDEAGITFGGGAPPVTDSGSPPGTGASPD